MRKIFSKFEFSLFLLLLLISCIFFSFEKNVATVKADTQTVTPYATPTSDPIVFWEYGLLMAILCNLNRIIILKLVNPSLFILQLVDQFGQC